jgi:hypothetical protein
MPGCGKTVLSASIIDAVGKSVQAQADTILLMYYFDFRDAEKQNVDGMAASFVSQLLLRARDLSMDLKDVNESLDPSSHNQNAMVLMPLMEKLLAKFSHMYLVIDALDEALDQSEFVKTIEHISHRHANGLHILVTSRRNPSLERLLECALGNGSVVQITNEAVDRDIQAYTHSRIRVDKSLRRWWTNTELLDEIEGTLVGKSHGM